jgi:UDP-N-acetylglucosamine 2-epimerase
MKIVTIIGTRPQFIKMPLLSYEFKKNNIDEIVIHTGQHYDKNMSQNIFENLDIPKPKYEINLISNDDSKIGKMIIEISNILLFEKPNFTLIYVDCDTTLAGAISSNKLDIPIIHMESGMRSFDKKMPEEINRIIVDHLSFLLFCPNQDSKKNLENEGITSNIHIVGDLMIELLRKKKYLIEKSNILQNFNIKLKKKEYYLLTIHRKSNSDVNKLNYIFNQLSKLDKLIIFPIHPRIKNIIHKYNLYIPSNIIIINPLNYIDMISLLFFSYKLITDSGGLQKEAYELKIPCITLRNTTEWIDTIINKKNILVTENIYENIINFNPDNYYPEIFIDNTSQNIINILLSYINYN